HALHPLQFRRTTRHRHPKDDPSLPTVAAQEQRPHPLHQRVDRHPLLPRQPFQSLRLLPAQRQFLLAIARRLLRCLLSCLLAPLPSWQRRRCRHSRHHTAPVRLGLPAVLLPAPLLSTSHPAEDDADSIAGDSAAPPIGLPTSAATALAPTQSPPPARLRAPPAMPAPAALLTSRASLPRATPAPARAAPPAPAAPPLPSTPRCVTLPSAAPL